jgi:hypothetical protein
VQTVMTSDQIAFLENFLPAAIPEYKRLIKNGRVAYYTSAATAKSIIENDEIWLRNVAVMNDFSEIEYGLSLMDEAFSKGEPSGEKFRNAVTEIFPSALDRVDEFYRGWRFDWQTETYIACVSAHDSRENKHGRLSMWRAYGNTALIVKNHVFLTQSNASGAFSTPVIYQTDVQFRRRLTKVAEKLIENRNYYTSIGEEVFVANIHSFLQLTALGSKHPGFNEEREWRIFFRPSEVERELPTVKLRYEVIDQTIQKIFALQLKSDKELGMDGADIPTLLDRIIIGPSEHPYVAKAAFVDILKAKGVMNSETKVVVSDIPLRVKR